METKMISCRIDVGKIEKLMAMYPGAGLTAILDSCIDYRLSGGKTSAGLSDNRKLSVDDLEGIKRLKCEASKAWRERNPDKVKGYTRKHSELHPLSTEKRREARQRYWLKKLRTGGDTGEP